MKRLCPREAAPCQSQLLMEPARNVEKLGQMRDQAWLLLIKETITLVWLRSSHTLISPQKWHMSFCQCKPFSTTVCQRSIQCLQENWDRKASKAKLEGVMGHLYYSHSPWSRRAFLNPHGFCQIDTNCPSKELRFILKSVKIHLLKLLG